MHERIIDDAVASFMDGVHEALKREVTRYIQRAKVVDNQRIAHLESRVRQLEMQHKEEQGR
jgi:hypothetical protein